MLMCGHFFNASHLQQWWCRKGSALCPLCKKHATLLPDGLAIARMVELQTQRSALQKASDLYYQQHPRAVSDENASEVSYNAQAILPEGTDIPHIVLHIVHPSSPYYIGALVHYSGRGEYFSKIDVNALSLKVKINPDPEHPTQIMIWTERDLGRWIRQKLSLKCIAIIAMTGFLFAAVCLQKFTGGNR